DPHRAEAREALRDSALHHVLEMDEPEHFRAVGDGEWRTAGIADLPSGLHELLRHDAAERFQVVTHRVHRALAHVAVAQIAAAHARLGAELDEVRHALRLAAAQ